MSFVIPIVATLLGGALGGRVGQIAERRLNDLDIHDILEEILEIIRDDPGLTVEERVLAVQSFIDWVTTTGMIVTVGENGSSLYEIPWSIPLPFTIPLPTPITSIDLSFRVPVRLIERLQAFALLIPVVLLWGVDGGVGKDQWEIYSSLSFLALNMTVL